MKYRIAIGAVEVCGRNRALAQGFERLGHSASMLFLFDDSNDYPFHRSLQFLERWAMCIRRIADFRRRSYFARVLIPLEVLLRFLFTLVIVFSHDVFIYSFGSSYLGFFDYHLIRALERVFPRGRKIVCQFHGSDSRPPYLDGAFFSSLGQDPLASLGCALRETEIQKRRIQNIDRLANIIIDILPQGYFHERAFVCRVRLGLPSLPPSGGILPVRTNSLPVVFHAPSSKAYKGTELIRQMVHRLKDRGFNFEYVELSGVKNEKIREQLARTDILLDQLYTDYPLNALATEGCWFGCAVLTGGHAVEYWKKTLGPEFPPVNYVHPDQIESELERMILDRERVAEQGKRAFDYISRTHALERVAERYLQIIQGTVPSGLWVYPEDYQALVGGYFMPEADVKKILGAWLSKFGIDSLQLKDKPALLCALKEWLSGS